MDAINKGLEIELSEPLPGDSEFVFFSPSKLLNVASVELAITQPAGVDGIGDPYNEYQTVGFVFTEPQAGPTVYAQYAVSEDRKSLYYYGHFGV